MKGCNAGQGVVDFIEAGLDLPGVPLDINYFRRRIDAGDRNSVAGEMSDHFPLWATFYSDRAVSMRPGMDDAKRRLFARSKASQVAI